MDSTEKRLRDFINETFPVALESELAAEESLFDAGILDSIGVLGLMNWLEREFDIFVDDDDVIPENIDGIGPLVRFVERKRAEAGLVG
ncbi:phosphopantetheine-binding protein [Dokdonella sp.]|jgi:acyl carrier protein|uniref:phosphopantetheine-binding protein n=1 Tax=Dokdonella sp. TaxID=2291710 RepID=UPI00352866FE